MLDILPDRLLEYKVVLMVVGHLVALHKNMITILDILPDWLLEYKIVKSFCWSVRLHKTTIARLDILLGCCVAC